MASLVAVAARGQIIGRSRGASLLGSLPCVADDSADSSKDPADTAGQVTGQVAGQVEEEVRRVILILQQEMSRKQLQEALALKGRANFEERYLNPALAGGFIERTVPDKPNSRLQKYRLTQKGRAWLADANGTLQ